MTGSPFSLVIGTDSDSGHFQDVLSTQVSDTNDTDRVGAQNSDDPGDEGTVGVETDGVGDTHESGQDETAGQTDTSGTILPS